ncbi:hypothetical protein CPC08DRAFT_335777 [Agrocybe pediades]|nr:hypothetical protein CPC08DRAFT_335777 [Agrocybe pediades]
MCVTTDNSSISKAFRQTSTSRIFPNFSHATSVPFGFHESSRIRRPECTFTTKRSWLHLALSSRLVVFRRGSSDLERSREVTQGASLVDLGRERTSTEKHLELSLVLTSTSPSYSFIRTAVAAGRHLQLSLSLFPGFFEKRSPLHIQLCPCRDFFFFRLRRFTTHSGVENKAFKSTETSLRMAWAPLRFI